MKDKIQIAEPDPHQQGCVQDAHEEGYDIEAGMFGPNLSKILVDANEWRKKAELFDKLRDLMCYVENGSDGIVVLSQDDATRTFWVSHRQPGEVRYDWQEYSNSLEQSLINAHKKHGGD